MRIIFYVQGEGRGHLTQAMAIAAFLRRRGDEVVSVGIGKPSKREIPEYVKAYFDRHYFVYKTLEIFYRRGRSLNKTKTAINFLLRIPYYLRSMRNVRKRWKKLKPDLIINFFEPIAGYTMRLSRPPCPVIAVSHQNLFLAEHTYMLEGRWADRFATMLVANMSASRARLVALSLMDFNLDEGITLCPPLLREETRSAIPGNDGFVLVYLLNMGYMNDIRRLSRRFPHVSFKCFVAHDGASEVIQEGRTLEFHQIDGAKFVRYMRDCACLISTAGFESTAEAALLGKPIGVVPVEGHFEQLCNAQDVQRSGLGIWSERFDFDIDALIQFDNREACARFREWIAKAPSIFDRVLDETRGSTTPLG